MTLELLESEREDWFPPFEVHDLPSGDRIFYRDGDHSYWSEVQRKANGWSGKRSARLKGVSTVAGTYSDSGGDALLNWAARMDRIGVAEIASLGLGCDDVEDMRNALDWLRDAESIGAALLPVITKLTTVLAEQLPVIQALAAEYSAKAAPAIAAVGVVLGPLIEQIGGSKTLLAAAAVVIGGVVVAAFTAWAISAASAAVATIAAAAPVLAVVAALALLTLAIYLIIDNWDEITANYPAVGRAFDDIKVSIQGVVDYVTENWDQIMSTIEPALIALVAVVEYQWEQIKVGIDAALKIIGGYLDIWIGLFTGDWERMWEGVKGVLGGAVDAITSSIGNAFDLVNELTGGKLGEFTSTVSSALSDAAGAVRSFYDDAVQPIQWLIDRFWQLIHAIQSIPTPHIGNPMNLLPGFASGTNSAPGGLAIVGENGPELVNLPRGSQVFSNAESRGMGGGVVINIEHLYATSPEEAQQSAAFLGYAVQNEMRGRGITAVRP